MTSIKHTIPSPGTCTITIAGCHGIAGWARDLLDSPLWADLSTDTNARMAVPGAEGCVALTGPPTAIAAALRYRPLAALASNVAATLRAAAACTLNP